MAPHAARRSVGKLGGGEEREETLVAYDPWHTADEY